MANKTPFYDIHVKNNGKIVEFAGFLMPTQFEGIIPEHQAVRTAVGVFDVSHMGEIEIRGKERIEFTNYLTTNNVATLSLNQIQYTTMLYPDAGIVDDLLVYNLKDRILLVVNASNMEKDYRWILDNKKGAVEIVNLSDAIAELAVQGPKAEPVMRKLFDLDLSDLKFYWAAEARMHPPSAKPGMKDIQVILSRTGYTGEDGFELYVDKNYAEPVWKMIFEAGQEFGIKPIGLGARDTLRFEMRYCLYGNDIDKTTNPLEAGLGWIVKFEKGDFIGKDSLLKIKEAGLKRKLVGFEVVEKGIPRPHQDIIAGTDKIGSVTSGTFSPSLKKGIGLGYVDLAYASIGTRLKVMGREPIDVEITKGPFYKHGSRK